MNIKRYVLASIAVFIAFQLMDFVIHGPILGSYYMKMTSLWRPEMMSLMWIMWCTGLVLSFLFVYIFHKGYEGKGILEGIRFGVIIGFLMNFVSAFNQFVIYPLPLDLTLLWFVFGMAEFIVAGIIVSLIYRQKE